MGRALQDDRQADFYANALNVDEFAEWVTYYPASGTSRSIAAQVRRPGSNNQQQPRRNEVSEFEDERIWVELGRDESHARGGVPWPQIGDTLVRDGEEDLERFAFVGEIVKSSPFAWVLEFSRPKQRSLGTAHRRS